MKKHLQFCCYEACIRCEETRHPQIVMKNLGITYQYSTPQSIADQWWFWNCKNIPDKLPSYLTFLDRNPIDCIGYGLSKKEAEQIRDFK